MGFPSVGPSLFTVVPHRLSLLFPCFPLSLLSSLSVVNVPSSSHSRTSTSRETDRMYIYITKNAPAPVLVHVFYLLFPLPSLITRLFAASSCFDNFLFFSYFRSCFFFVLFPSSLLFFSLHLCCFRKFSLPMGIYIT